jgi:hypothetical protein
MHRFDQHVFLLSPFRIVAVAGELLQEQSIGRSQSGGIRRRDSILLLLWDDATNTPTRLRNIAFAPGDQMNMDMEDGLAGIRAGVDADIKACDRLILAQDQGTLLSQHPMDCVQFGLIEVKVVCDMPLWEDKRM